MQASTEGMYRLRGEDAITGWPNAMQSIIHDRDVYMTAAIKAAATGAPWFALRAASRCQSAQHIGGSVPEMSSRLHAVTSKLRSSAAQPSRC